MSPTTETQLRAAHARGMTNSEIAAELGLSPATVRQYAHLLGLRSHRPRKAAGERAVRVTAYLAPGEHRDLVELARAAGCSVGDYLGWLVAARAVAVLR